MSVVGTLAPKSWESDLSFDASFVSAVLAMVLSEYWKRLEEFFFQNDIILRKLQKYHFKKESQAFFNILKEPLLVQKQTILQKKGLILSFFGAGKFEGVTLSGELHAHLPQKDIGKKN